MSFGAQELSRCVTPKLRSVALQIAAATMRLTNSAGTPTRWRQAAVLGMRQRNVRRAHRWTRTNAAFWRVLPCGVALVADLVDAVLETTVRVVDNIGAIQAPSFAFLFFMLQPVLTGAQSLPLVTLERALHVVAAHCGQGAQRDDNWRNECLKMG